MEKIYNIKGDKLSLDDVAIPCGVRAKTYFSGI